jgi:uncharacterized protein YbjT (DUF2867 family)
VELRPLANLDPEKMGRIEGFMSSSSPLLVTGATGYIGGRLVGRLLEAGRSVRVLVRNPARLQGRAWQGRVEVVQADVLSPDTLPAAMDGIASAYYLIHGMGKGGEFHDRDLLAAYSFGQAAEAAGVRRIIYLGGLGNPTDTLSEHLRSRQRTGDYLRYSSIPVTEFRAAVVIGSGSASFEMIRYMVEGMPILFCPAWAFTRVQPIAVRNVLEYLVAALDVPESCGRIVEIGGADVLTYSDMMMGYARARGLRRLLVRLPALPPLVCALMVHWLTPVSRKIALPLIEGMSNEVVVRDDSARRLFPEIKPFDYRTATQRALMRLDANQVETTWSDALASTQGDQPPFVLTTREGMVIEQRRHLVNAPPGWVYRVFTGLGGQRGWLYLDWLWVLRGALDRAVGGVGFRRGRRHPDKLRVGEALDFWRVEALEPGRLLRLRAEMKVPGAAWLELEARPLRHAQTMLVQTAIFAPKGFLGLVYWYVLYPFHALLFSGLVRRIARSAEVIAEGAA